MPFSMGAKKCGQVEKRVRIDNVIGNRWGAMKDLHLSCKLWANVLNSNKNCLHSDKTPGI